MKISIILPVYNKADVIIEQLVEIINFMNRTGYDYEIIVIDDKSRDNTFGLVNEFLKNSMNIILLKNEKNFGKGYTVRKGINRATGEIIIFMDGDLTFFANEISRFIDKIINENYDVVIGSRRHKDTKFILGINSFPYIFFRHLQGVIFNLFVRMLTKLSILDTQCGFKAFKRETALKIIKDCHINRFSFDIELLVNAKNLDKKISEIAITLKYSDVKDSTMNFFDILKSISDVIKIVRYTHR